MESRIEEIAEEFADDVRVAFVEVYGPPKDRETLRSIIPTWSKKGVDLGWHDPHPGTALVLTEFGWVHDPYASREDHEKWDHVAHLLKAMGWDSVSWGSINPAVHYVHWMPPDEWNSILMKRAMEKSR